MSIADDCGLILEIGKWMLREACLQVLAWLQAGRDYGKISVNVSAKEILSKDFLSSVRAILDETGLVPHHLEIEVTERGLMHDEQQTTPTLFIFGSKCSSPKTTTTTTMSIATGPGSNIRLLPALCLAAIAGRS
jgi:EAL domain-containing protein (putative c-di-GMP-specific phosphodiesterase class I)